MKCPRCSHENPAAARFCSACGAPLVGAPEERRKPATLLFCDVEDSTGLAGRIDAEAVREMMVEYFGEMRGAIEAHGGTVEKFIGDAVLGVFGVPVAHEDDALRAVRAAVDMRERLAASNAEFQKRFGARLALRIGINTGEVVSGDVAARESFVSGDAVNVAARLEQAAPAGGILLGETTFALVGQAVDAESVPPLAVKGKSAPVGAYALLQLRDQDAPSLRDAAPFVARESELAFLAALLGQVRESGTATRALVVGEAGVGKSRLVDTSLASARDTVRVFAVRCLPYGDGITYLPLVQLVRQAGGIGESDDRAAALERIDRLFEGQADAHAVTPILAQVVGLADGVASAAEIAWAARRLAEVLARERPLVLVVDDLQWAKEPLVDLLHGIAERGRAAILVLCLARPEFGARSTGWVPDLRLQPLPDAEAQHLLENLVAARAITEPVRDRLLAAAGGNPLFLEELAAFVDSAGETVAEIPPTLDALLTARLDALDTEDRRALECGSVEGQVFHRGAVLELAAAAPADVDSSLVRLTDGGLVRAASSTFDGEQAFQFRHLLVRDASYRGTPKRRRATLHVVFATWLERKLGPRRSEVAEIVGYHLEQAWLLRRELGPLDEESRAVGARAAELLADAAGRSSARGDAVAALALLTRAATLAASEPARIELTLERGIAAREAGEFELSATVLAAAEHDATAAGMGAVAARAELELALLEFHLRPVGTAARLRRAGEAALATFDRLDDEHGRAVALSVLAQERWLALRCAEMERLLERALGHAERAHDDRLTASVLVALARAVLFGPRPATEAAERCEDLLARARRIGPTTEAGISMMLGVLEATRGNAERARDLARTSIAVLEETAPALRVAVAAQYAGLAELTLGDAERAERHLRRSFDLLERLGERAVASTAAALLARALVELQRFEEAERLSSLALAWSGEDDVATQAFARSAYAFALVARGAREEARRQAAEAVELSSASDFTNQRGDAFLDLAVVLRACGDEAGARQAAAEARACFVAKGNLAAAERAAALAAA